MIKQSPTRRLRDAIIGALSDYESDINGLVNASEAGDRADVIIKRLIADGWLSSTARAAAKLGSAGGKARARKLSPKMRKDIATRAAHARWGKR